MLYKAESTSHGIEETKGGERGYNYQQPYNTQVPAERGAREDGSGHSETRDGRSDGPARARGRPRPSPC